MADEIKPKLSDIGFLPGTDFDPYREIFYSSKEVFRHVLTGEYHSDETDAGAYLPSPSQIRQRKQDALWLESLGFSDAIIRDIMLFEHPHISVVYRLVEKHGALEAWRIIRKFRRPKKKRRKK